MKCGNYVRRVISVSLRERLQDKKKVTVHVDEIRANPNNIYPMCDVEELANQLLQMGEQITPGEAYLEDQNDDKRFTLTSGERAISLLYKQKLHDGMMDLIIIEKPKDIWDEYRRIRTANIHRADNPDVQEMEIKQLLDEYDYLMSIDKKPKGLKRDWIAEQLGISGRTIDRRLKRMKADTQEESKKEKAKENDVFLKSVENHIQERLQTKIKVTGNEIKIRYCNTEDLNRILERLNLLQESLDI